MTGIIIFICTTLCGFLCGKFIQKGVLQRQQLFSDVVRYVALLKINVQGKQKELRQFNAEFAQNCSQVFADYLSESKLPRMNALQKKLVADFFGNLDCISGNELLQHMEMFETQFADCLKDCDAEAKKSSVYVKTGLLLGAMAGILFL